MKYDRGDWKTKQFLNVDQVHDAGRHHALEVDSMSDKTDFDGEQKQNRKRVPGLFSTPVVIRE